MIEIVVHDHALNYLPCYDATLGKSASRIEHGLEVAMKTDKEIEEMFGVTREEIEALAAPWDAGEIDGEPAGEVIIGRPLKFGEALKVVGFKETEQKIERMDERADSLGMKRSDYLRWLVDKDLAAAGVA